MAAELDERTIPAEAGLVEASVSFTKGCYTGQELVARIDSRGSNVPRHLRAILLSGPARAGARLYRQSGGVGGARTSQGAPSGCSRARGGRAGGSRAGAAGRELGRLTTVALSPRLGWVALGYVGAGVEAGSALVARDEEGEVEARVEPLPA